MGAPPYAERGRCAQFRPANDQGAGSRPLVGYKTSRPQSCSTEVSRLWKIPWRRDDSRRTRATRTWTSNIRPAPLPITTEPAVLRDARWSTRSQVRDPRLPNQAAAGATVPLPSITATRSPSLLARRLRPSNWAPISIANDIWWISPSTCDEAWSATV
jgi:hypothetical protein